jgi:putative membrane protein
MIAALALVTLLAQVLPTPPPAPLSENVAPVKSNPAPFDIPTVAGIDRTFALAAIQGNTAEMEMAQLAVRRTSVPEVKGFAQKMMTEHMGLTDAMMPALTRALGGTQPAQKLAAPDILALAHLQTISDVDFDQMYLSQQVGDHLATVMAFHTEADNGTDPQLKELARKWLPTIQAHLELAVSLARHVGGSSPLR